jgi:hypothetical protein
MDHAVARALGCNVPRYGVDAKGCVHFPLPGQELPAFLRSAGTGGADDATDDFEVQDERDEHDTGDE